MKFKAIILKRKSNVLLECVQGFVKMIKALPNKQDNKFYIKFEKSSLLLLLTSHYNWDEQVADVSCRIKYEDVFFANPIIESKNENIIGITLNPESLVLPLKSSIFARETTLRLSKRDSQSVLSFSMIVETKKMSTFQLIHDCKIEVLKPKLIKELNPLGEDQRFSDEILNTHFSMPPSKTLLRLLEKMKLVDSKYAEIEIVQDENNYPKNNINETSRPHKCNFICMTDRTLNQTVSIKTFFNNCIVFKTEFDDKNDAKMTISQERNHIKDKLPFKVCATFDINHLISALHLSIAISDSYCVATITQNKYLSMLVFFPNVQSQISIFLASVNNRNGEN
ncbi:cell cycle checkpoint [Cryptosporidium felis]|nr:cell cycle checkpoint [Cryptosporidium felis]